MTSGLKNKVAVVTGGASGIGRAVVETFSRNGTKVAIVDMDIKLAKQLAKQLKGENKEALAVECDVTSEKQTKLAFDKIIEKFGIVDILHVNAGINIKKKYIIDCSIEDWNKIISVNLTGAFLTAKYGIMHMIEGHGGSIIFTSSNWAFVYEAGFCAYAASKGAIISFARALALDHAKDNIRVNVICPGDTRTPLMERMLKGEQEGQLEGHAQMLSPELQGQTASAEEIANLVVFLASEDSSAMKGSVIMIDHGQTLGYGPGLSGK
jgi:NAD(P)-dependent dehydrogenase (short-subunit alcohol dehydrogenase family)